MDEASGALPTFEVTALAQRGFTEGYAATATLLYMSSSAIIFRPLSLATNSLKLFRRRGTAIAVMLLGVGACTHSVRSNGPSEAPVPIRMVRVFTGSAFTVALDTSRIGQTHTGDYSVRDAQIEQHSWVDTSPHRVRMIRVAPDVDIEVLDWGGAGEPLVFLAGFGNTAHIFDGFAPQFSDRYHVLGITRRGFGASSEPASGYDSPTLARDIITVLDSLHMRRASFVAHSFGGSELNYLATHSPERVSRLIYLEAGLDFAELYADTAWVKGPFPRPPRPSYHLPAIEAQTLYSGRMAGPGYPESDVRAILKLNPRGDSIVGARIVDSAAQRLMRGTPPAQFTRIRAPVLAVYGNPTTAAEKYPWWNTLDSAGKAQAEKRFEVERAILTRQHERFRREVSGARVIEIAGGRHYVFLNEGPEVAHEMRVFLALPEN